MTTDGYKLRTRVLWVVDHLGYAGALHGAGRFYANILPRLDVTRFQATLCVLRKEESLQRYFSSAPFSVHYLERGRFDPLTLFDLIRLIKREKTDILHLHGYGASNFGRLAGLITGVPRIVHAHDEDPYYPWHQRLADLVLSPVTSQAIAVSETVKASCVRKRKIPAERIVVLHNGIPLQEFMKTISVRREQEREHLGIAPFDRVVGTVGGLREEKGIAFLLKSAAQVLRLFPRVGFLIVGDGPLRAQLEALAARLDIRANVVFAGFREDIPAILPLLDVMVMPSLTEGSPMSLLEAMAAGRAIVASRVGGIPEILEDQRTALLVPPKDNKALSQAILQLLSNPSKALYLGGNAAREATKYDVKVVTRRIEGIYTALTSSDSPSLHTERNPHDAI